MSAYTDAIARAMLEGRWQDVQAARLLALVREPDVVRSEFYQVDKLWFWYTWVGSLNLSVGPTSFTKNIWYMSWYVSGSSKYHRSRLPFYDLYTHFQDPEWRAKYGVNP